MDSRARAKDAMRLFFKRVTRFGRPQQPFSHWSSLGTGSVGHAFWLRLWASPIIEIDALPLLCQLCYASHKVSYLK